MRFADPQFLWFLLLLPLLALAGWWSVSHRRRALRRFAGGRQFVERFTTEVSVHRRAAKMMLVGLALLTVILTAARPQWGTRMEEITRRGSDVVVVIDTSLSMAAEDVAPNRLGLARHAVDSLLRRIEGNRVALVTFAGRATTNCPLTLDLAAVRLFLDTTDVQSVSVAGTSLTEALEVALAAFGAEEPLGTRSRAVVLLTDGEDHEGQVEEIADTFKRAGVPIFAIGVGTARGAPIPLTDAAGFESGYKKDRAGKVVTTRLDETVLQQLALTTGGRYYRATAAQDEIDEVAKALGSLDSRELGATLRARFEERFQIPLLLAIFALLADALLGDRRRERQARR